MDEAEEPGLGQDAWDPPASEPPFCWVASPPVFLPVPLRHKPKDGTHGSEQSPWALRKFHVSVSQPLCRTPPGPPTPRVTLLLGASILLCLCSYFGLGVSFPLTWGHPAWLSPSCSFPWCWE